MLKNFLNSNFGRIFFDDDDGSGGAGAGGAGAGGAGAGGAGAGGAGAGGAEGKEASVYSGALVEKKDPISGDMIKIPIELEKFFGHVISSTRNSVESQYKPMVEKLEGDAAELSDVRAELLKIKEASMTAEELATANAAKKIAEHEARSKNAIEDAVKWKSRFFDTMITNDIFGAFGDTKLCNPQQTAILLQNEGRAQVEPILDDNGTPTEYFQTKIYLKIRNEKTGMMENVEGTPKELFKKWVNQDENLHHQLNNLAPGGSSAAGKGRNGKIDWLKMSAEQRLAEAPRERGGK